MKKLILKLLTLILVVLSTLFGFIGCDAENATCSHEYGSWQVEKESTCTVKGVQKRTCNICGESETSELALIEHKFNDENKCVYCNYLLVESTGLKYELNSNNSNYYTVTGIGICTDKDLVIPKTYAGKIVNSIAPSAFYGCDFIQTVYLHDSIETISTSAFEYCSSLVKVNIPKKAKVSQNAFANCTSLSSVIILNLESINGKNVFYNTALYNDVNNWQDGVFYIDKFAISGKNPTTDDTVIDLRSDTLGIAYKAFENCANATEININEGITSIGNDAFVNCSSLISVKVPNSVTHLWTGTFNGCNSLQSISIPFVGARDNETNTPEKVFGSIFGVVWNQSGNLIEGMTYQCQEYSYYFYYNIPKSLKSVTITNATRIPQNAFINCDMVESITINESVTTIGNSAFENCTNLTEVNYNAIKCSDFKYNNYVFAKAGKNGNGFKLNVGKNVKKIPNYFLSPNYQNTSLKPKIISIEFAVGSICENIGYGAFEDCTNLEKVYYLGDINSWVQIEFGNYYSNPLVYAEEFYINNELVTTANITTATKISNYVFNNYDKLTSVTIGNSVTSIGEEVFTYCTNLTSITVDGNNTAYKSIDGVLYSKDGKTLICYPAGKTVTVFTIPDSVTSISDYAFCDCDNLTSVTIGSSVTSIDHVAFYNCTNLTSVTIPNSVTSIGDNAFSSCDNIEKVYYLGDINGWAQIEFSDYDSNPLYNDKAGLYINNELVTTANITTATKISNYAFYGYNNLTSVTIPNSVTSIGDYAFYKCKSLTIYCEAETKPSGWRLSWNYSYCPIVWNCNNNNIADDGYIYKVIDGVRYSLNNNIATVARQSRSITIANIISSIIYNGTTYSVTSIGEDAFSNCTNLEKVYYLGDINSWVQIEFGNNFSNPLVYAKEFYINNELVTTANITTATKISNYAFYGYNKLTSVTIGNSVESIGERAFYNCDNLTSVTIGNSVTSIGDYAFYNCPIKTATIPTTAIKSIKNTSLKTVILTSGKSIGDKAFSGCTNLTSVTIPNSVISIGEDAFAYCENLTSVIIPNSVTYICEDAFYNCYNLTSVTIGNNVTSIGCYAFANCANLEKVYYLGNINGWVQIEFSNVYSNPLVYAKELYINNELVTTANITTATKISNYAFYGYNKLTSVTIGNSVTSIDNAAFSGCTNLTSIMVDGNNTAYKSIDGVLYSKDGKTLICYPAGKTATVFTIPNSVTSIGNLAFNNCDNLTSIEIPNIVTSIGEEAFGFCDNLTSVTIPNSVTSIGNHAFYWCDNLTSITYNGTKSEWNSISKGSYWNNKVPATYVNCTDGTVTI